MKSVRNAWKRMSYGAVIAATAMTAALVAAIPVFCAEKPVADSAREPFQIEIRSITVEGTAEACKDFGEAVGFALGKAGGYLDMRGTARQEHAVTIDELLHKPCNPPIEADKVDLMKVDYGAMFIVAKGDKAHGTVNGTDGIATLDLKMIEAKDEMATFEIQCDRVGAEITSGRRKSVNTKLVLGKGVVCCVGGWTLVNSYQTPDGAELKKTSLHLLLARAIKVEEIIRKPAKP